MLRLEIHRAAVEQERCVGFQRRCAAGLARVGEAQFGGEIQAERVGVRLVGRVGQHVPDLFAVLHASLIKRQLHRSRLLVHLAGFEQFDGADQTFFHFRRHRAKVGQGDVRAGIGGGGALLRLRRVPQQQTAHERQRAECKRACLSTTCNNQIHFSVSLLEQAFGVRDLLNDRKTIQRRRNVPFLLTFSNKQSKRRSSKRLPVRGVAPPGRRRGKRIWAGEGNSPA